MLDLSQGAHTGAPLYLQELQKPQLVVGISVMVDEEGMVADKWL